ncbi:endolysin [Arthrobacter phage Ottawa]|nr:endolysin [Arthrobacter phage Kharcho]WIC89282.1 endolysin [Arthrobacter phage Ottawa]
MARIWPVEAPVTQEFGKNPSSIQPNGHTGRDYGVPIGTGVKAIAAGTVLYADWATKLAANNIWWIANQYAGIVVLIDHGGLVSVYGHLNETHLNPGNKVTQGQIIGKSGTTGLSTGPHLHFEVFGWPLQPNNGYYGRLDPRPLIPGPQPPAAAAPLAANQRRIVPNGVVERSSPVVSPGTKFRVVSNGHITMKGYVIGERVNGQNLWYVGLGGRYYHCSGFTSQSTAGLKNLTPTPKPPAPPAPAKAPVVTAPPSVTTADITQLQALKVWLDKFLTTQKGK